jgi:hypothetical protein
VSELRFTRFVNICLKSVTDIGGNICFFA